MKRLQALLQADSRSILRDPILMASVFGPLLFALLLRLASTFGAPWIYSHTGIFLADYARLSLTLLLFITAITTGTLVGFVILDEKDEQVLSYLAITPLSRALYLSYRLITPLLVTLCIGALAVFITGIPLPLKYLLLGLCIAALEALICSLLLASFAQNKVEGLAYSKLLGVFLLGPFIERLGESPWQYLACTLPPFWLSLVLHSTNNTQLLLHTLGGVLFHLILLFALYKRFLNQVIGS